MLTKASVTTNDAAMRRMSGCPFGLRWRRAVCIVAPPRRIFFRYVIVVAPCIRPAGARNAAHEGYSDGL